MWTEILWSYASYLVRTFWAGLSGHFELGIDMLSTVPWDRLLIEASWHVKCSEPVPSWCFCGAALIVFIHVLLKVFCSFQELCLWQYTSSLTQLYRKSTMSFLNLWTLSRQVSMCSMLPSCVPSLCWLITVNAVMTGLKYYLNYSLLLSQNSKVLVRNEHYLSI